MLCRRHKPGARCREQLERTATARISLTEPNRECAVPSPEGTHLEPNNGGQYGPGQGRQGGPGAVYRGGHGTAGPRPLGCGNRPVTSRPEIRRPTASTSAGDNNPARVLDKGLRRLLNQPDSASNLARSASCSRSPTHPHSTLRSLGSV